MKKTSTIFLVLLLLPILSFAQDTLKISLFEDFLRPPNYTKSLDEFVALYFEKDSTPDLKKVFNHINFQKYNVDSLKKNQNAAIWGKLVLQNNNYEKDNFVLHLAGRYANFVDVYVVLANGMYIHKKAGCYIENNLKDIEEDKLSAKILLKISLGEVKTIFFRIQNIDKKPTNFQIKIEDLSHWQNGIFIRNLAQGFFQGSVGILLIFHLLSFFYNRKKFYIYYSIYLLGTCLYFLNFYGLVNEFVLPNYPLVFNDIYLFSTSIIPLFYLLFIESVFRFASLKSKFWVIYIKLGFLMRLSEFIGLFIFYHVSFDFDTTHFIHRNFALIETFYFLVLCVGIYQKKNLVAYFFILGTIALYIGLFISIWVSGKVGMEVYGNYIFQAGVLLEIIFFALGLSYQNKLIEVEKVEVQAAFIAQLQRNEELQLRQKNELERKVLERTLEIELKNQSILIQNDELHEKNQTIIAAITYAKRIQLAILPSKENFNEFFDDFCTLFMPRDIVSGDFYWLAHKVERQKDKVIVVLGDCTGHGVPGAFMSMIGCELLNKIIHDLEVHSPDEILHQLDIGINNALKQHQNNNTDGMDLMICLWNRKKNTLEVAGVLCSLFYWQKNQLHEIKGSRVALGGNKFQDKKIYQKHTISLFDENGNIPTQIFMCSDGIQDQFGGANDKKFSKKKLTCIFEKIVFENGNKQEEILTQEILQWKGEQAQTDDISCLGFKIHFPKIL